ncbi:MAG: hypothetical protein KGM44_14205 [bacterium]|nr:hypothetical protein [bacterium]
MKVRNFPDGPDSGVAGDLLERARHGRRGAIVVVGLAKDVGKTVTAAALLRTAQHAGAHVALTSIGRDGESIDAATSEAKPPLVLPAGTVVATAVALLPRSPALEVLEITEQHAALGRIAIVRLHMQAALEVAGANTGSAMRDLVDRMRRYADLVIVDGAVDRLAATAGGGDAVVVATGANAAATLQGVVARTRALVRRLSLPGAPPADAIEVDGALTPERAAGLLQRADLERGIVVPDPFSVQLPSASFESLRARAALWCRHPLYVVGVTVCPSGRRHDLEPVELLRAVAGATCLAAYDIYRNAMAVA